MTEDEKSYEGKLSAFSNRNAPIRIIGHIAISSQEIWLDNRHEELLMNEQL